MKQDVRENQKKWLFCVALQLNLITSGKLALFAYV